MLAILLPLILVLLYYYFTRNHDYWSKRNVKHDKPIPLFGNVFLNLIGKKSVTVQSVEMYNKYPNEKVVGMFRGSIPELIVRDPEIAKKILTTDFAFFYPRGLGRDPALEPVLANLFHVDGDLWKLLRQRLTSTFTTAKLKAMFPLVVECAEKLQHVGEDIVSRGGGECDVRELMARFTTEFIGACGFGIQMNTINNENSLFRDLGRKMFNRTWQLMIIVASHDLFPEFRRIIPRIFASNALLDSVTEILMNIRKQRNYKPIGRNDFVDLLLDLETKGKMIGESIENRDANGKPFVVEKEMDIQIMAAQLFVFFAAGFETSSSATSYLLHELAYHPEEQNKIQEDIDRVLAKYDNKLCYDSIAEMSLLSMAFKEAMRKFPSLGTLHRICAKKYTIEELGITLDPGVRIVIPLQAIQTDEKYFDKPFEFIPERFANMSPEQLKNVYMPFGEGPRACIGARLGEMQSLAGLVGILHKFSVVPGRNSRKELKINQRSNIVQSVEEGVLLKLELRKKDN